MSASVALTPGSAAAPVGGERQALVVNGPANDSAGDFASDPAAGPATLPATRPAGRDRADGWTADRRRLFLTLLADGHTVEAACARVGLSRVSAYALRRRDPGFALGWTAAALLAREALADMLTARAIDGQTDSYTRADGETVTRHRHDNRLAQWLLARLDRLAEPPAEEAARLPELEAARVAAGDFEGLLALVGEEAAGEAGADALDAFVAAQSARERKDCKLKAEALADRDPVWWRPEIGKWVTLLPPPADFRGQEYGCYGDPDYWRVLTRAEREVADARYAEQAEAGEARRDAFFGFAVG